MAAPASFLNGSCPVAYWQDQSSAVKACAEDGDRLMHAGEWRSNKAVVLAAAGSKVDALLWASPELRDDRDVLLTAVKRFGCALRYADSMREDREIVLIAVAQDGDALQFVGRLTADKQVVLTAVRQYPWALQYASDTMRSDVDIVLAALSHGEPSVLKCVPEAARTNERVLAMLTAQQKR